MKRLHFIFILILSILVYPLVADDHEVDDVKTSDTIMVTALKQETDIKETSVAVTAITADDIESKNIRDLEDAQFSAPGVTFTQGTFTGANAIIRGIGAYTVGASFSGNVSYRVDDTNVTSAWFVDGELFDIKQFEILRGPQGTLFGGNNPAGTFNLISNSPSDSSRYVSTEFGDYGTIKLSAASNYDLGSFASTRLAIRSSQRDGFVENLATGQTVDGLNYLGVRSKTEFYLSDTLTGHLTLFHQSRDDSSARTSKAACNPNELYGCDPWGSFPTVGNVLNSSSVVFSAIDVFTNQYPGTGLYSDIKTNIYEGSTIPADLYQVSYDFEPQKTMDSNAANIKLHWNLDNHDVYTTYSTYDHVYESYGRLNDIEPDDTNGAYYMGNITANMFGLGEDSYSKDFLIDRSYSHNNQNEFEVRMNSKSDGPLNYTSGLYYNVYDSHTVYAVSSPGMEYFGDVSKGPIGEMYPELAGYGGTNFWLTFTGAYLTDLSDNFVANYTTYMTTGLYTAAQAQALAAVDSYDVAAATTLATAQAGAYKRCIT